MSVKGDVLLKSPLFKGIREEDLAAMLACLSASEKHYKKDETVFLAGDRASRIGVVLQGQVQIVREDVAGHRMIQARLAEGDIFGETFACALVEHLPVSVEAAADCSILLLDYRKIITVCSSSCLFHSRLIENMLSVLAGKNLMLSAKMEHLSKRTTREKLMSYLMRQAAEAGRETFEIPFNRQELADYLCVDRSNLSRELSRMQEDGIVSFHKNKFKLHKL